MDQASHSGHVYNAVKQHMVIQDNFEQVLNQQPNPPLYTEASTGAQYGGPYGGQYGRQYGVSPQPNVSSEMNVAEVHTPHQRVSGSKNVKACQNVSFCERSVALYASDVSSC